MKLLLLECAIEIDEEIQRELDRCGHRVVRHGFNAADRTQTIHGILERMPEGFRPDAIVCWSVDYNGIPEGIEEVDAFTIAQINDYHLAYSSLRPHLRRFDAIWTDALGVEIFRRGGVEHFLTSPLYSYAADIPAIEMPEKDLDVVFIGGMNHAVHQQRSLWLRRLARLADRHKILIAGGIHGKEYLRQLARGKIVFNHSVRGEMNMRCFEAPMLGGLPMLERENREAPRHFPDGVGHVYYDARDFEERIAFYLARHEEREKIVRNAREIALRMRREQLLQAIAQIEPLLPHANKGRSWQGLGAGKQALAVGVNLLQSPRAATQDAAAAILQEALARQPEDPAMHCALGFATLLQAGCLQGEPHTSKIAQAKRRFEGAAAASERHVPSRISLAWLALDAADWPAALHRFQQCIELTAREGLAEADLEGLFYPVRLDYFRVGRERALLNAHGDPAKQLLEQARFFRMRALEGMAMALAATGEREQAIRCIQEACRCSETLEDPDPMLFCRIALILWKLGDEESAIAFGDRYDQLAPLDAEFWEFHLNRIVGTRRFEEARRRVAEYAACAKGYADAAGKEELFRKVAAMLDSGAEGFRLWEEAARLDREGKLEESEHRYRHAKLFCGGASAFALDFGFLLLRLGKPEEALAILEPAKSDPATREAAESYAASARERLASIQTPPARTATTNTP